MRLLVNVIKARNLRAMDSNGFSDPYVKLQLGKQKFKTKVIKMNLNPTWDQEFNFEVGDTRDVLKLKVYDEDMLGMADFLGQVRVPFEEVLAAENSSLGTQWYRLHPKDKSEDGTDCGEICVTISVSQNPLQIIPLPQQGSDELLQSLSDDLAIKAKKLETEIVVVRQTTEISSISGCKEAKSSKDEQSNGYPDGAEDSTEHKGDEKSGAPAPPSKDNNTDAVLPPSKDLELAEVHEASAVPGVSESEASDVSSDIPFDDLLKQYESTHQGVEMPGNLKGGLLIDHSYVISTTDLNALLFSPTSTFLQSVAEFGGSTEYQMGPWRTESDGKKLRRLVSYTTAPSKLVKAVRATEEQTYLKADGKEYSVLLSVSTPHVPFGDCFRTEVLFCVRPGPVISSEEQSSHLVISWRMNFLKSTVMRGMIENGAKQGMEQSYKQFADLLSQKVKPIDIGDDEEQLCPAEAGQESDWKLTCLYLGNFTVLSSLLGIAYVLIHVSLVNSSLIQGLELSGLDLPDSISEIVFGGLVVLQLQLVFDKVSRLFQARQQKGGDHGVKAGGDGWLLTIALIEGTKLAPVDSTGFSDPYVVFSCNGKTKTSSIKFQTLEPKWNEIFEFDAMDEPPSMMYVNVYDFDGPLEEVTSLGHAEINLLKCNFSELADIWVPLQGNLAQSWQSKVHLRIFFKHTKGTEVVTDYLNKMEKEVGKKMTMISPRSNTAFQELFSLPGEEFLISNFTCHLKRKMPTQGHLFLSPRTIGFYSNVFGRKTKFFFLWEDIEDIQEISPSMSTMWSPSLLIILRKGRGMDAKHGARSMEGGKLKFYLQSFASFDVANRTIKALWKGRSLSLQCKVKIAKEESEVKILQSEDNGIFVGIEDAKSLQMSEVFSSIISLKMVSLMEIFEGGSLEMKVMEKVGCLNFSATKWESDKPDEYQRQLHYKLDKKLSPVGGEVTSTQQKFPSPNKKGWIIEEVMELQGVLLGDYFTLHIRYQIEDLSLKQKACNVQVSLGIEWLKSTQHQKKITKNVMSGSSARLKEIFNLAGKELAETK